MKLKMSKCMKQIRKKLFGSLKHIDLFGVSINMRFKDQEKYQTRFGGLFSILLILMMLILTINIIKQLVYKTNPSVLVEDVIVQQPSKFYLNKENFSFAVGLYGQDYQLFSDSTYFTVEGIFSYKLNTIDEFGKKKFRFINNTFQMSPCKFDDFQVETTEQYFQTLDYKNLFCLDYNQKLYLEGQFDSEEYSVIEIKLKQCTGEKCKSKQEISDKLRNTFMQIYYSTSVVQTTDYNKTFKSQGQTQFYYTNRELSQAINMQYMNTYVVDQIGIFDQQSKQNQALVFNRNRLLYTTQEELFIISIFLEKNKEKYYYRSYISLKDALTQLGDDNPDKNIQKPITVINSSQPSSQKKLRTGKGKQPHKNQLALDDSEKEESIKRIFQNSLEVAKVRTKEFFLLILQKFSFKKSDQYEMVQLGIKKVYQYTDISFIINKLVEIEKIKHVILDDYQIKLFEFIPKPKIKSIYRETKKQQSSQQIMIDSKIQKMDSQLKQSQQEINILSVENKDMKFKAKKAQDAFNQIYKNKKKQSKIDKKLIIMLDKDLICYLQKQTSNMNFIFQSNFSPLKKIYFQKLKIHH